jgi:hypothetical protein
MWQAMSTILLCLFISFISTARKLQFNPFNERYTVLSGGIPEYRVAGG